MSPSIITSRLAQAPSLYAHLPEPFDPGNPVKPPGTPPPKTPPPEGDPAPVLPPDDRPLDPPVQDPPLRPPGQYVARCFARPRRVTGFNGIGA